MKKIEYETEVVPVIGESISHAIHTSIYNSNSKDDIKRIKELSKYMPIGSKLKITIEIIEEIKKEN